MNQCRPCGCKGVRSCLICEREYNIKPNTHSTLDKKKGYVYCYLCRQAWSGWDSPIEKDCPNHPGDRLSINGIFVLPNFLTEEEKNRLLMGIDKENWDLSQSGRRKQNYGPKCNFKKRKIQTGNFIGFPQYSKFVHDKFKAVSILNNFYAIEQCSLEYDPKRGASIDPHIDDCWIWGERIVTVNVLGDTFLSLSKFNGDKMKYNVNQVELHPSSVDESRCTFSSTQSKPFNFKELENEKNIKDSNITVRVYMPEKSLIILYGTARYEWEHFVLREDIKHLRICLAYREFTSPYLPGGEKEHVGSDILAISKKFW